ncbi:MAG: glycoside hydrolase family 15 protein [Roseobacter sp.]
MSNMTLSDWVEFRRISATRSLRAAVSATHLCHTRAGFGWQIRPAPGSVLASSRLTHWDPEPDYFHHWVRDAAIVMRVLPDILKKASAQDASWWRQAFADYISFSLKITDPDETPLATNPLQQTTSDPFRKYLRPDAELQRLNGLARLEEPRCAADGTPDLERWSRPQDDGPALRASSTIAILDACPDLTTPETEQLIRRDLAHLARIAGRPSIGPWEDPPKRHDGFTLISQWDALSRGADWLVAQGCDGSALLICAQKVMEWIDRTADPHEPAWKAAVESPAGCYDSATVLAILHAQRCDGPLAITAERTLGTVAALEDEARALYTINENQKVPAIGRFKADDFFGGNPWLPITLGFAELHYKIAVLFDCDRAFKRADRGMALIRKFIPDDHALPEQIDRHTGAPTSCLNLSWSAAAFIGAAEAHNCAHATMRPSTSQL